MESVAFLERLRFGDTVQIDKMIETPFSKEVRICMSQGSVMKEHRAPGPITIMVLSGSVSIASGDESVQLGDGAMVYFDAKVPHSLEAHEESVVRLSLAKNDAVERVFSLVSP